MYGKHIYHYCAKYSTAMGATAYIDGIAKLEDPVMDQQGYRRLKNLIDPINDEKLIITGLNFLGRERELGGGSCYI